MAGDETSAAAASAAHIGRYMDCIRLAECGELLREFDRSVLSGYSGIKLISLLQRLAAEFSGDPDAAYVEVGVFQGLTLLSVAGAARAVACYGIDNFAFFDPDKKNIAIVESRRAAMGATNAMLINADYEDALESARAHIGGRKIAVYFVDGPHDYRSQLMCLQLALPHLHRDAVIIIDDSNYAHVRQANRDFMVTHPAFKLLFEAYTRCHPGNMDANEHAQARQGWWNGVNVIVHDPDDRLEPMLPPTNRYRGVFEAEHIAHAAELPDLGGETGKLLSAIHHLRPLRFVHEVTRLKAMMRKSAARYAGRFPDMNTDSADLVASRKNKIRA